jgi:hypothetical protein
MTAATDHERLIAALRQLAPCVRESANGVRLGRKQTLAPHQQLEAIKCVKAGKETQGEPLDDFEAY